MIFSPAIINGDEKTISSNPNPSVDTSIYSSLLPIEKKISINILSVPSALEVRAIGTAIQEEVKIHVKPSKERQIHLSNYFVALGGLLLVGICKLWEMNSVTTKENLVFNLLLMTGALTILIGASSIVLENSVHLAEVFHVPQIIIGLTFVSIGTSTPEIFTSIISSWEGKGGLALGDIYGSWITQLSIFLGIVILIRPSTVKHSFIPNVMRDAGFMVLSLIILSVHMLNGSIKRWEAVVSISLFLSYNVYLYINARRKPASFAQKPYDNTQIVQIASITDEIAILKPIVQKKNSILKSLSYLLLLVLGIVLCYFGARFMVQAGADTARIFNVSEHVIGTTIIGFGTGLPELIVSAAAMIKNKPDIAYGNLIGSNIVDPLFSISLGVLIRPVTIVQETMQKILGISLPVAILVGLLIIFTFSRRENNRRKGLLFGIILIVLYLVYIALTAIFA